MNPKKLKPLGKNEKNYRNEKNSTENVKLQNNKKIRQKDEKFQGRR